MTSRPGSTVLRRNSECSSKRFATPATGPSARTSILAAFAQMLRSGPSCPCSASGCLADPRMVQGLPVEPECGFAVRRVMVEGHDEDPVHDGPQGAEDEPIQDGADGPAERRSASRDPPDEGRQAEREQEEEHEPGAEDPLLVRAPSVLQQRATAAERLQRADPLDAHGREDEQGRDRPPGAEGPRDEPTAGLGPDRGETEQ